MKFHKRKFKANILKIEFDGTEFYRQYIKIEGVIWRDTHDKNRIYLLQDKVSGALPNEDEWIDEGFLHSYVIEAVEVNGVLKSISSGVKDLIIEGSNKKLINYIIKQNYE